MQKLRANPSAVGVFGYSYLEQNADAVQGSIVDGQAPTFDAIASGSYPLARPLFFYVKKAHVDAIPGIRGYVAEFTSDKAMGDDGYLAAKGLVPLPSSQIAVVRKAAQALELMKLTSN